MKLFREEFIEKATYYKEKEAIVGEHYQISWERMKSDVLALSTELVYGKGQRKDSKFCLLGENSYEWTLIHMSAVFGAGIVVPLDKELSEKELCKQAETVKAERIFCTAAYMDKAKAMQQSLVNLEVIGMEELVFSQMLNAGNERIANGISSMDVECRLDDCICITFTSGTTSDSKGVMLSQRNLITCVHGVKETLDLKDDDRLALFLPMYHIYACFVGVYGTLFFKGVLCISSNVRRIAQQLKAFRSNKLYLVPALAELLLMQLKQNGQSAADSLGYSISWIIIGGAKMPPSLSEAYKEEGIKVMEGYGITEASSFVTVNPLNRQKVGSVGKWSSKWQVKIAEDGEVLVKGGILMLGYYEGETNVINEEGWLLTGDIGWIDEEGYLYILGRKKNVIILKNGKNVFPEELESKIQGLQGVQEVLVYESEALIVAEVYTEDMEVEKRMKELNELLPSYARIQKIVIRDCPFEKSGGQKIKRRREGK